MYIYRRLDSIVINYSYYRYKVRKLKLFGFYYYFFYVLISESSTNQIFKKITVYYNIFFIYIIRLVFST